jgi:hypothetical protein
MTVSVLLADAAGTPTTVVPAKAVVTRPTRLVISPFLRQMNDGP